MSVIPKRDNYFSLSDKAVSILFVAILLIGLFLRCYFYLADRDLGADEAHLALNFIHTGYKGLTQPLENFQSAPIFFLWSVETITRIFGFSAFALRLVPFVISVFSFPFFYFFVRDLTKNRIVALLAFLLFALNASVLYYATELKPYTIDISAFILIGFLLCSDWNFVARRRMWLLALTGGLLLLFSISTVIILFCAGLYMIRRWYQLQREANGSLAKAYFRDSLYVWGIWVVVFLFNYFIFIYKHPYGVGMKNIWSWTFCPRDIFSPAFGTFIRDRIEDTLFSNLLLFSKDYYFPYFLLVVFSVAVISLVLRKQYNILLFTLFPVLVHLALSMLQLYPFFQRFILYLLPALMILFSYGLVAIIEFIAQKIHWSVGVLLLGFFVFATNISPVKKYYWNDKEREIKPVLDYIDKYYPNTPVILLTPYTLYYYYSETGRVKNKNFKPIEWELTADEFSNHRLIRSLSRNYLVFYSIGNNYDGFGNILNDLKQKGLVVKQFHYSIFGIAEIKPDRVEGQGELVQNFDYQSSKDIETSVQDGRFFMPLWSNNPLSFPVHLDRGKYLLLLTARGDAAAGIYPHINIRINDKIIGSCDLKKGIDKYPFIFETDTLADGQVSIAMDNDEMIKEEDRNAFIDNVFIFHYDK